MTHSRNKSPVGWYVASYLLRFTGRDEAGNDDPEKKFLTWENTILIKAGDLDEAYDKTVKIARQNTKPYKGGCDGVWVQWLFEGITEILPIYEKIGDGSELMWAEHRPRKLKNIRASAKKKRELKQ